MTDLEMVQRCAEAMGYSDVRRKGDAVHKMPFGETISGIYWPLEDDAQAMALMKKFPVETVRQLYRAGLLLEHNNTINEVVVKCVAKMQQAKP